MSNTYIALVARKSSIPTQPISVEDYNKTASGDYESNIITASKWTSALSDKCRNMPHTRRQYTSIEHTKYLFANITTNFVNPPEYAQLIESGDQYGFLSRDISGTLHNFRVIGDIELFNLWVDQYTSECAKYCKSLDYVVRKVSMSVMPGSMRTYTFLQWVQTLYPDVKCHMTGAHKVTLLSATIMTGAQFKSMYNLKFVRLLTEDMIHNGFHWKLGTNVCENFCPVSKCGFGLYFIQKRIMAEWLEYSGKKMYWKAKFTIPDHATVKIEIDKYATSEMFLVSRKKIQAV